MYGCRLGLDLCSGFVRANLAMFNHLEYDTSSLKEEYDRDVAKGIDIAVPMNYYPNDDPSQMPINNWRAHAHLMFSNWISEIFLSQTTLAVPAHTSSTNFAESACDYDSDRRSGEKFDTVMVRLTTPLKKKMSK